ncbi:hypothetical protein KIM372_14070 [Bombiscardovia nodaiensis]|uniref:Uncharacterized protein n=1 Tax=Bombiscardovia nodaiensis TaxID=2932181 RepID=A0ABM8B9C2_9BIFI|nr:hypothetical protein KIM372_14070 [Bombiscardovia nodaiensis]
MEKNEMKVAKTRKEALRQICKASIQGLLGIFVGAGMSKELIGKEEVLSW